VTDDDLRFWAARLPPEARPHFERYLLGTRSFAGCAVAAVETLLEAARDARHGRERAEDAASDIADERAAAIDHASAAARAVEQAQRALARAMASLDDARKV
jgi:hypothetical protein